jgi:hypothetical protein
MNSVGLFMWKYNENANSVFTCRGKLDNEHPVSSLKPISRWKRKESWHGILFFPSARILYTKGVIFIYVLNVFQIQNFTRIFYSRVPTIVSHGRAIAEAVSRWLPTAAARVQSRVWSSGICGGQDGVGAGFLRVLRCPLPFIPPNSQSSQSPGAGTRGQWVAEVPSGPSLDSNPHYAN